MVDEGVVGLIHREGEAESPDVLAGAVVQEHRQARGGGALPRQCGTRVRSASPSGQRAVGRVSLGLLDYRLIGVRASLGPARFASARYTREGPH